MDNGFESIVEDTAPEWSLLRQGYGGQARERGYTVGHGPHLPPGDPATMKDLFGERGRLRQAIRLMHIDTSFRPFAGHGAAFPNVMFGKCHLALSNY